MSRIQHFTRGVATSYIQLGVNLCYTAASVPLALHYLSKAEFALWALVMQVAGYVALVDMGMGASVSRLLADYKDDRNGGRYGSVLKTGQAVFLLQGALIAAVGVACARPLTGLLLITPDLAPTFASVLVGQCVLLGLSCWTKFLAAPLWCHQRYDVGNHSGSLGQIANFAILWLGFSRGWGLATVVAANAAGWIVSLAVQTWVCVRCGYFPKRGAWGRVDRAVFGELFTFGRDIFMMALGNQLLSASQIIIVTRALGIEAAATWAICSKAFTLAQQMVGKIFEMSSAGLTEMFVRGERDRLCARFRDLVLIAASLSVVAGAVAAVANSGFVAFWTKGRVSWAPLNDALMGIGLVILNVSRCHTSLVGITRQIRGMRFAFLIEGFAFLVLAWSLVRPFGFPGVILAGILANILCTGIYGHLRTADFFGVRTAQVAAWLLPSLRVAVCIALGALGARFALARWEPRQTFLPLAALVGCAGLWLGVRFGMPPALRAEVGARWQDFVASRRGTRA